jgi:hypothetical protein
VTDLTEFERRLRRMGKKEHVAAGLVSAVAEFETYLRGRGPIALNQVSEADIREFAASKGTGQAKHQMRALSLYLKFAGRADLAKVACAIREGETSRTRRAFRIRDFRGVDQDPRALEREGVIDVDRVCEAVRPLQSGGHQGRKSQTLL